MIIHEETEELRSVPALIRKKVPVDKGFEDRIFVRIPASGVEIGMKGTSILESWCYDHYGNPRYLGPWFKVSGYIILDEKTYTHWKLCE